VSLLQEFGAQGLQIFDQAGADDGESSKPGAHDEGLGVTVADHPDSHRPLHGFVFVYEFGFELGLADVMDGPVKPGSQYGHTAVLGSHVGMVISAVKKGGSTIVLRYNPKNSTHNLPFR
jgi:hypothetical protein